MEPLIALLLGLSTGVFITWFPGMLNLQAVATSVRLGRSEAYRFSLGMSIVIGAQTMLAVGFADLLNRPGVLATLRIWAVPLLTFLAVGFTVKGFRARAARRADRELSYTGTPFWRGLMLGSMNVLNIPFIFAIAGFLMAAGYLSRGFTPRMVFVPGVAAGALLVFFAYARLADWISRHANYLTRNINFLLGGLLAMLALVQAARVY